MADYRAIEAVGSAWVHVLRTSRQPQGFEGGVVIELRGSGADASGLEAGVSIFLYHIAENSAQRLAPKRGEPSTRESPPGLWLDLHFLVTASASSPRQAARLLGWTMHTLNQRPILTQDDLELAAPGVFGEGESIRLQLEPMAPESIFRIRDALGLDPFCPSVAYRAGPVPIESAPESIGK